jgi:hypothetical protein
MIQAIFGATRLAGVAVRAWVADHVPAKHHSVRIDAIKNGSMGANPIR